MEVPGNDPPVHGQHGLDHAGDPGGGFEMADVGLDRADQQGAIRCAAAGVRRACRLRLDGIADVRARPVRFHVVDVGGLQSRPL